MSNYQSALIIVQRSNGDVLLTSPLINQLKLSYPGIKIDLLINDDTLAIASLLPGINHIHLYSYSWKKKGKLYKLKQEILLGKKLYKKYDLSICLVSSDRAILYSILAANTSIATCENTWWKKKFLTFPYEYDHSKNIVLNNLTSLKFLNTNPHKINFSIHINDQAKQKATAILKKLNVNKYFIFHPAAQYAYKMYPVEARNTLLTEVAKLGLDIIVTGGPSEIDMKTSKEIDDINKFDHVHNLIGETSFDVYAALVEQSEFYLGMDTVNMHIAAALNKKIYAIFGPTFPLIWGPWSNEAQSGASHSYGSEEYGNVKIFQAKLPCVPCGMAGCDDKHGRSECLYQIPPKIISDYIKSDRDQEL
jgi:heptosyltransferase-3